METDDDGGTSYAQRVGARLRSVRKQKGLSLQDVEATSQHEFKASVLGAYERGERAISVPRLQRLARFYDVPADRLLPDDPDAVVDLRDGAESASQSDPFGTPTTIDIHRLQELGEPSLAPMLRFITMIQLQRQDYNGRVITVRRDDIRALACLVDETPEGLRRRLDAYGLRAAV